MHQKVSTTHRRATALLIALGVILTGCEPILAPDTPQTRIAPKNRAEALAQRGQHQAAAEEYMRLAAEADYVARQGYLILAAREHNRAGNPETAQKLLNRVGQPIDPTNLFIWSVVAAEVAVGLGNTEAALGYLAQAPAPPERFAAGDFLRIKGDILFRLGRPAEAVQALLEREIWLESADAIAANQRMIWEGFENWGGGLTQQVYAGITDPVLRGWLDLGFIAWTRRTNPAGLNGALRSWRQSNQTHPANDSLIPDILRGLRGAQDYPQQVALLLPLSSRQKSSAEAIRDGFIAAHFSETYGETDRPQRPVVRIYDVAKLGVAEAYQRALLDGADFVVGPLVKSSVQALSGLELTAPTLALNFLPDEAPIPSNLFQFALSPEDEARQIAERAASLGQLRALLLAPNNEWGNRVSRSFRDRFQNYGGQILDYRMYTPEARDFSASIRQLLLINESDARKERLTANLGVELKFEPRRRQDIDLIFLAANADAGKLIRPQLRFHYAGTIPTYSTSAIYQAGSANNADLNGIIFPDVAWILAPDGQAMSIRKTLNQYWPGQAQRKSRLYAMGFDAYHLIPLLYGNSARLTDGLPGMTGRLYLSPQGQIFRRLPWARIRRGKPTLIDNGIAMGDPTLTDR